MTMAQADRPALTLDEAERLVRAYWDSPLLASPLSEAARFARLMTDILNGLSHPDWRLLLRRLDASAEPPLERPVVDILARVIDRRPRLGIPAPEATAAQRYAATGNSLWGRGRRL